MNTRTHKLNLLFEKFAKDVPEYKSRFTKDGIINEQLYNETTPKILFIGKEPNNPEGTIGDFREDWNLGVSYTFARRIAEWSYGIINSFPEFDTIVTQPGSLEKSLKQIAFMNIKKSGGKGTSEYNTMMDHATRNVGLINEQIEIISPDIIITGTSWSELRNCIFPCVEWQPSGYGIEIGKIRNSKIIDFYHPSSRNAPAAAYSLLQNIIRSEKFKSL